MKRKLRPVWRMIAMTSQVLKSQALKQEQTRHMFFLDEDSCRIGQSCSTRFANFWREVIQSDQIHPDEIKKALNERGLQAGIRHSWFECANHPAGFIWGYPNSQTVASRFASSFVNMDRGRQGGGIRKASNAHKPLEVWIRIWAERAGALGSEALSVNNC